MPDNLLGKIAAQAGQEKSENHSVQDLENKMDEHTQGVHKKTIQHLYDRWYTILSKKNFSEHRSKTQSKYKYFYMLTS